MKSKCQSCNKEYKIDIHIDDELWGEIKPKGKPGGGGMLCGGCIVERIENKGQYGSFTLTTDF